jgi:hypothetical protein
MISEISPNCRKEWGTSERGTHTLKRGQFFSLIPLTHCIVPWNTSVSPFRLKRVFFKECMILHFKMLSVHKHSFHMLTQFSQGNNLLEPPASNLDSFLQEIECFFHSLERVNFAQRWYSSHFKTLRDRQYSF